MSNSLVNLAHISSSGNWKRPVAIVMFIMAALLAIASVTIYIGSLFQPSVAATALQKITDVSLAGDGTASFDQQALDPTNGHLFIAHQG
jgi:cell division septal protein FtsQ